jgi:SH3 domain protein
MWKVVTYLWVLLLLPAVVLGKSLYVKDNTNEALVRSGPSLSNKILVILKSGQEVSLVGEDGDYYLVATPSGNQGYVLKYLMTEQSPVEARLQDLEQKTQKRIKELEEQNQAQAKELVALRQERTQLEAAKKEAEARAELQTNLASQLQARQDAVEQEREIHWFLAGAGVLLIGLIFGRLWKRSTRRNQRTGLSF